MFNLTKTASQRFTQNLVSKSFIFLPPENDTFTIVFAGLDLLDPLQSLYLSFSGKQYKMIHVALYAQITKSVSSSFKKNKQACFNTKVTEVCI